MVEHQFVRGRVCRMDEHVDLSGSIVVAEVFSKALAQHEDGLVASFVVADGLAQHEAEAAMNFFASQPTLLVDAEALVDVSSAEFPALVVIRYTEDPAGYVTTMAEYGILQDLPSDSAVSAEGWKLFWGIEALRQGHEVPQGGALPDYDYRGLRRKVMSRRAMIGEDRDPWMTEERDVLRDLTRGHPEGCEVMMAEADDIDAALEGSVDVEDLYSVVIPTRVERQVMMGAIADYVPQAGREIVVAHGLDAVQAARVFTLVAANPAAFVSKDRLVSKGGREMLETPIVIPDRGLNWITTDFTGRRDPSSYERLRSAIAGEPFVQTRPVARPLGR